MARQGCPIKKIIKLFIQALLLSSICLGSFVLYLNHWVEAPISIPKETIVALQKNMPLRTFANELQKAGVISSAFLFHAWVRLHPRLYEHFQAGTYRFMVKASPQEIIKDISEGKTYALVVLEFTIPEGANFAQIQASLLEKGVGSPEEFHKLANDTQWLEQFHIKSLEGFLFPATYQFFWHLPTAKEALERPIKEFFARIPSNYAEKIQKHDLTLEQWVTLASLIEKETAWDEERSHVAEVIWNRLRDKQPLGIDAAIIYGIKDYDGNITSKDLKDKKNPYNTRIIRGLPPSPIASPSLDSLLAVFTPSHEGYYYYVLIPNSEHKHHFSKSLKEHNAHVKELVKAQRKR